MLIGQQPSGISLALLNRPLEPLASFSHSQTPRIPQNCWCARIGHRGCPQSVQATFYPSSRATPSIPSLCAEPAQVDVPVRALPWGGLPRSNLVPSLAPFRLNPCLPGSRCGSLWLITQTFDVEMCRRGSASKSRRVIQEQKHT